MIDIRNVEMVQPDIQRQYLIKKNQNLGSISYVLLFIAAVSLAAYGIKSFNKDSENKNSG